MKKCNICNKQTLVESEKEAMCISCGFSTTPEYKKDNKQFDTYLKQAPKLVQEIMVYDSKLDQYWVPTIVHSDKGMVFPINHKESWMWGVAKYKLNESSQQELDIDNIVYFFSDNYMQAVAYLNKSTETKTD